MKVFKMGSFLFISISCAFSRLIPTSSPLISFITEEYVVGKLFVDFGVVLDVLFDAADLFERDHGTRDIYGESILCHVCLSCGNWIS